MKGKIKTKKPQVAYFKPIKVELKVETIEEARLLYHVFNRARLKACIFCEDYGMNGEFSEIVCSDYYDTADFRALLKDEIENQGFGL